MRFGVGWTFKLLSFIFFVMRRSRKFEICFISLQTNKAKQTNKNKKSHPPKNNQKKRKKQYCKKSDTTIQK